MTKMNVTISVFMVLASVGFAETPEPGKDREAPAVRVGVYDSRAIAVAFVESEIYKAAEGRKMDDLKEAYLKAGDDGDQEKAREITASMMARQQRMRQQVFGTAPVDDLLAHVKDRLAGIVKEAGVVAIVSKWDAKALAAHENAEQVDVTMRLVDAFKPSPQQRKSALEIQKTEPVSLEPMDHVEE